MRSLVPRSPARLLHVLVTTLFLLATIGIPVAMAQSSEADGEEIYVAALECLADPGYAVRYNVDGVPPIDCTPQAGIYITITADETGEVFGCETGDNGTCVTVVPSGTTVTIYEDPFQLAGHTIVQNTFYNVDVATGATFVNVPIAAPELDEPEPADAGTSIMAQSSVVEPVENTPAESTEPTVPEADTETQVSETDAEVVSEETVESSVPMAPASTIDTTSNTMQPAATTTGTVSIQSYWCPNTTRGNLSYTGGGSGCTVGPAKFTFYKVGGGGKVYFQTTTGNDGVGSITLEAGGYEVVEEHTYTKKVITVTADQTVQLTASLAGKSPVAPAPTVVPTVAPTKPAPTAAPTTPPATGKATVSIKSVYCGPNATVTFTWNGSGSCTPGSAEFTFYKVGGGGKVYFQTTTDASGVGSIQLDAGSYVVVEEQTYRQANITLTAGQTSQLSVGLRGTAPAATTPTPTKPPTTPTPTPAPSTGTAKVVNTGGVGLRCRTAPVTGGVITVLPEGATVTVRGAATNGWLPVVCGGQNGWVSTQYVSVSGNTGGPIQAPTPTPTTPPTSKTATVVGTGGAGLLCRTAPVSGSVITTLPEYGKVEVLGESNGWAKVRCGGTIGWASMSYLTYGSVSGGGGGTGAVWMDVNLSRQYMVVYRGNTVINQTYVSTGRYPQFETPTGNFYVNTKLTSQTMSGVLGGEYYYVPNVPWVMYFTNRGHAIHGAYWHNNFGYRMSHGCINLPVSFAGWLYGISPIGTRLYIHY